MKSINRTFEKILDWKNEHVSDRTFLLMLSLLTGIVTGLATVLLKTIVHTTGTFVNSIVNIDSINMLYFAMPLIGIALTVIYVKYHVKDSLSHGISKVLFAISKNESKIKPHNCYSSIIASTLTVGFGGSVGLEAPTVLTGSAIGSNLSQLFKFDDYRTRTLLLGCGAAAAVSCIFKAPIAGVIFALEVLMLDLSMVSLIPLLIAAVTGSIISTLLLGNSVVFYFVVFEPFNIHNTFYYMFLGVFCGFIGLYFTKVLEFIENRFLSKIKNHTSKLLTGGILLGVLIFFFPPLYGEGYDTLQYLFSKNPSDALHHSLFLPYGDNIWIVALFLLLVVIFKAFAVAFTTGGGGVGGVFAPALFLGGIAGYLSSIVINFIGISHVSQRNFALVGMAGVMAAIMHAPLTAIFLIAEITSGYELFVPIIITATTAYLTIHRFETHSIYTKRLAKEGDLITHDKDKAVLTLLNPDDLIERDFNTINYDSFLGDLILEVAKSHRNIFPVIDNENRFKGMIFLDDIRKIMFDHDLYEEIAVKTLIKQPKVLIYHDDTMKEIVEKFEQTGDWNMVVVNGSKYIGFISKSKMLTLYRELLIKVSYEMG